MKEFARVGRHGGFRPIDERTVAVEPSADQPRVMCAEVSQDTQVLEITAKRCRADAIRLCYLALDDRSRVLVEFRYGPERLDLDQCPNRNLIIAIVVLEVDDAPLRRIGNGLVEMPELRSELGRIAEVRRIPIAERSVTSDNLRARIAR